MPRATALAQRSAANKKPGTTGGGVNLGYTPPEFVGPPPGTFDPGLEAEVRASERGLLDLEEQERTGAKRGRQDTRQAQNLLRRKITQGRADLARQKGYAVTDAGQADTQLHTNFARDLEDLAIAKQRGQQDYDRTLTELQHKYATAAQSQGEAATKLGVGGDAGTTAASSAVRGADQAYDKTGIDQTHQRQEEDLARREGRVRGDFATNEEQLQQGLGRDLTAFGIQGRRLGQEGHTQFNALHLAALRAGQDRATKISHARREQTLYSTDVAQQAYYQAHQQNPHILFPTPAAAGGVPGAHPAPQPRRPSIGGGVAAPVHTPHVHSPVAQGVGLGPSRSRPRRPYTRYGS